MTNLTTYVSGWMVLAFVVIGLALYRKFVSAHEEDPYIHISEGEASQIPHQVAVNQKIALVDRIGEYLTIFTLIIGIGLACVYVCSKI